MKKSFKDKELQLSWELQREIIELQKSILVIKNTINKFDREHTDEVLHQ